jgi:DNA polymerase-3 subunit alpha
VIVAARRDKGRFTSFFDFCDKVDASVLNKRVVESLIKSGAFDSLGHPRKALMEVHADHIDSVLATKRNEAAGQFSLFASAFEPAAAGGAAIALPILGGEEWDKAQVLSFEKEMLGQYVSDHPLLGLERVLAAARDTALSGLRERSDGAVVKVAGILAKLTKKFTKRGEVYVVAELEDLDGAAECIFFPQIYQANQGLLAADQVVVVKARVDGRDETPKLVAMDVSRPAAAEADGTRPVELWLAARVCNGQTVDRLKGILSNHRGRAPVHLNIEGATKTMTVTLGDQYRVDPKNGLYAEIKAIFGPSVVRS